MKGIKQKIIPSRYEINWFEYINQKIQYKFRNYNIR